MKKQTLAFALLLFSLKTFSQETDEIAQANTISLEKSSQSEELELSDDSKKMSLSAFTGAFPEDFGSLTNLEFSFAFKFSEYWLSSFVGQGEAPFLAITENSSATQTSDSEGFLRRTEDDTVSFLQMGVGLGMQGQMLNWILGTERLYETTTAYLAYMIMEDDLAPKEYGGVGIRADYAINYRFTEQTHIAAKISYRVHSLVRPEEFRGQDSDERTLNVSWLSSGLELAYFF